MRSPRLLVFDWDGTLMDSVASIVACLTRTVAELGLRSLDEAAIRDTIGLGMTETMDLLFPGTGEDLRQRVLQRYRQHWFAIYRDDCVVFPGAERTLHDLASGSYLLAIATGKGRRGLDRDLERTGLGGVFATTRSADEAPSKPQPQMLLSILDELAVEPGEALMIGDTTHDLEMARHAGVPAVGVTSGSHPRPWLEQLEPLACLDSVVELPQWLHAQGRG